MFDTSPFYASTFGPEGSSTQINYQSLLGRVKNLEVSYGIALIYRHCADDPKIKLQSKL